MKNISLDCYEYSVQELSLNEQEQLAGGSLLTWTLGAIYGATLGALVTITNYMYNEQYGYPMDTSA